MSLKRKRDILEKNQKILDSELDKLQTQISIIENKKRIDETQTEFTKFKIYVFDTQFKNLGILEELFNIIFEYSLIMFITFYNAFHMHVVLTDDQIHLEIKDNMYSLISEHHPRHNERIHFGYMFGNINIIHCMNYCQEHFQLLYLGLYYNERHKSIDGHINLSLIFGESFDPKNLENFPCWDSYQK